jgi:hypothetical protein
MAEDSAPTERPFVVPERFRSTPEAYAKLTDLARAIGRQLAREEFARTRRPPDHSEPTKDRDEAAPSSG